MKTISNRPLNSNCSACEAHRDERVNLHCDYHTQTYCPPMDFESLWDDTQERQDHEDRVDDMHEAQLEVIAENY